MHNVRKKDTQIKKLSCRILDLETKKNEHQKDTVEEVLTEKDCKIAKIVKQVETKKKAYEKKHGIIC